MKQHRFKSIFPAVFSQLPWPVSSLGVNHISHLLVAGRWDLATTSCAVKMPVQRHKACLESSSAGTFNSTHVLKRNLSSLALPKIGERVKFWRFTLLSIQSMDILKSPNFFFLVVLSPNASLKQLLLASSKYKTPPAPTFVALLDKVHENIPMHRICLCEGSLLSLESFPLPPHPSICKSNLVDDLNERNVSVLRNHVVPSKPKNPRNHTWQSPLVFDCVFLKPFI